MFRSFISDLKKAVSSFFHFLNADRCRFYARQLDRIQAQLREVPGDITRNRDDHDKVYAMAARFDMIEKIVHEEYQ